MANKRNDWPTLNTYIDGNTVRKANPVSYDYQQETSPRKRQPEEVPVRRRQPQEVPDRKRSVKQSAEPARRTSPAKRPVKKTAERPIQQPKTYREPKERTSLMTPIFAVYTTVILGVVLLFAFRMLAAQTALAAAADNVTALETTLNSINQENTKLEALVEAEVDLEYIYQVATEELGLVSADDSQVIYYDQIESGYVRQNEIIP